MKSTLFRSSIILLLVLWILPTSLYSQTIKGNLIIGDTSQVHQVVTKRGDVFLGRITQIQNTEVRFLFNKSIELTFQLQDLVEISVVDPANVGKKYTFDEEKKEYRKAEQPVYGLERGFMLPTGYLLPAGAFEYRNIGVFYSNIDYGLTDNITIGAGAIPLIAANMFQLRLRVGAPIGKILRVSLNGNGYFGFAIEAGSTTAAAVSGAVTVGNPGRNFTAGAGYGFGFGGGPEDGFVISSLGGSYLVSRNWRLLGEIIFSVNRPGLFVFTGGAHWMYGAHRLEMGIGAVRADFSTFPFPYLGYGYRF